MRRTFTVFCILSVVLFGCMEERKETPTKGNASVLVAESVAPLMEQEQLKFQDLYPEAHVQLTVMSDREAIAHFFNDTTQMIISSRPLNDEERQVAKRTNLAFAEYKVAIDGIAIIVNEMNPVTQLRTTELDSIYSGKVTQWKAVGGKSFPIEIALPSPNDANCEVVGQKILHDQKFIGPTKVTRSSREMLEFVSGRPNAIGMVGIDWIDQKKDNVRVLQLMDPFAPDSLDIKGEYFSPVQAYLYKGFYPLTRVVNIYSKADSYSVATGFTAFITSAPGQKIVLNSGLVPATMPIRLVELTNKGAQQ